METNDFQLEDPAGASRTHGVHQLTRRDEEIVGLDAISERVIYPHVFPNADREVGGVLVGRSTAGERLPVIIGAIPAISADEQRATLTFTQEAWEHIHSVLDSEFDADAQIVGWYHSHPGFGIFLSNHDLFIHRNFFSGESQIAVVVDPRAQTEGSFAWVDGEIEMLYERPTPQGWSVEGQPEKARKSNIVISTSDLEPGDPSRPSGTRRSQHEPQADRQRREPAAAASALDRLPQSGDHVGLGMVALLGAAAGFVILQVTGCS